MRPTPRPRIPPPSKFIKSVTALVAAAIAAAIPGARAVWLARGAGAGRMLPHADKDPMTLHLATIGATIGGAGWHKPGGRLTLPDTVSTVILPPDSPELNPQENIRQYP
ncbi:MAG: hypothetical protein HWD60_11215 [Defluviicoccus sp.]|nr:MAG: hypothetical protein HWD60_11215 [Defluviicoccus sp.]